MDSFSKQVAPLWKLLVHPDRVLPGFPVFLAGSFALLMYERITLKNAPLWTPNDCDVFVIAPDEDAFDHYVRSFTAFLSRVTDSTFSLRTSTRYQYSLGLELIFKEIEIDGIGIVLSFIYNQAAKEPADVINSFDIDIVRVSYDLATRAFTVPVDIKRNIIKNRATVLKVFKWASTTPTDIEERILAQTLSRMRKYCQRGYVFTNTPAVVAFYDPGRVTAAGGRASPTRGGESADTNIQIVSPDKK